MTQQTANVPAAETKQSYFTRYVLFCAQPIQQLHDVEVALRFRVGTHIFLSNDTSPVYFIDQYLAQQNSIL